MTNKTAFIVYGAIAGLFIIAATADYYRRTERESERAEQIRGAFEFGVRVGEVKGGCKTLKSVAEHNPTSDWARSEAVVSALASCDKLPPQPEIVVRGEREWSVR